MAINKMLIDASHPEETRVAVVRGSRIEEFDFESQEKKQIRGNIYLAKVTRVEPSLQAAFIDYGGNRHGFLAFSEIHPDYYQIPVADRLALLEEEAREASEMDDDDDGRSQRRNRGRKRHSGGHETRAGQSSGSTHPHSNADFDDTEEASSVVSVDEDDDGFIEQPEEVTEIVHGRELPEGSSDEDDDDSNGRSMAAMVETDSISEPAPDSEDDDQSNGEEAAAVEKKAKPKRKPAAKKPSTRKTKAQKAAEEAAASEAAMSDLEAAVIKVPAGQVEADAHNGEEPTIVFADEAGEESSEPDNQRAETSGRDQHRDRRPQNRDRNEEEDEIESVGQEDAMEEVSHRRKSRRQYKIQEVIKRRQIMLVQVVKEERGNKGAALTTYLSLAGRYSVLMPNTARGGGISRKITNVNDRKRLKEIAQDLEVPKGMGVILRTAGALRTKQEINRDFEYLMRLWENVRTLTLSSTAPCLVYEEGSLIKRSIRDLYDKDTGEIIVQGEAGYKEARDFMRMLMPSHAKNVKPYLDEQSLFSRFGVESQLDRLLTPQVTLKSGGYIVINQTEALVSIDVNSGRSTREHSIEDTALQTNLEAADEVARQLRLRDLAGLIVIDFIDMEENRNNRSVEKRLKDALKNDRARIQVGRISHFGLMEMSRQRIRASVMESTMEVCPHCLGLGHVRSHSSIALHVFRGIEDYLTKHPRNDAIVRCPIGIALDLLNNKRASLMDMEERFGLRIIVQADPALPGQSFVVEKGEPATGIPRKPVNYAAIPVEEDDLVEDDEIEETIEQPQSEARENGRAREERAPREEGDGQRRKRRRRRGKRNGNGAENGADANNYAAKPGGSFDNDEEPAEIDGEDSDVDATADGGPVQQDGVVDADGIRRKRRRGKRGGKRNRRDGETGALILGDGDQASEDSFEDAEFVDKGDESGDFVGETGETAPTPRPAGHIEPLVEKEADELAAAPEVAAPNKAADDSNGSSAVELKRGRNTRRPKASSEPVVAARIEAELPAQEAEVKAEEPAEATRKSGWWRGRGFF